MVLLREFIEHKTLVCCYDVLRSLKKDFPKPEEFKDHWITVNNPSNGFIAHADTYRDNRNPLPYLEKNPVYLKRRLTEINQSSSRGS
ncbi:MAG TPA: hypothetical protein VLG44_05270 [Chlamydiales bacterium]|nr:hypothetical protein [Chlamydiales bacterium]